MDQNAVLLENLKIDAIKSVATQLAEIKEELVQIRKAIPAPVATQDRR